MLFFCKQKNNKYLKSVHVEFTEKKLQYLIFREDFTQSGLQGRQNENANGLLRQYFPKTMSLVNVACNEVKIAVNKLNSRPRKCLGFKAPYQVFFERTGIDARQLGVVRL